MDSTKLEEIKRRTPCKLYQQVILRTDLSLNAFGTCPKCFWDIADHENEPAFQQAGISIHKYSRSIFFYLSFHQLHPMIVSVYIFYLLLIVSFDDIIL